MKHQSVASSTFGGVIAACRGWNVANAVRTSVTFTYYLLNLALVVKSFHDLAKCFLCETVCCHLFILTVLFCKLHIFKCQSDVTSWLRFRVSIEDMTPSWATANPHMITFYHIYLPVFFPSTNLFFNFRNGWMTRCMGMTRGLCYSETFKAELSLVILCLTCQKAPLTLKLVLLNSCMVLELMCTSINKWCFWRRGRYLLAFIHTKPIMTVQTKPPLKKKKIWLLYPQAASDYSVAELLSYCCRRVSSPD